ncbi:hypothetical protein TNCV_1868921 [Trichonephila clavipes]|nr:hypothetical protein TNCV_1868921 [Trichonephila clavipes]
MCRVDTKFFPKILSVEKKDIRLAVAQNLLETIKTEPISLRLLAILENEKVIERIPISKKRCDNTDRDGGVEHHTKRSLLEVILAVEGMLS